MYRVREAGGDAAVVAALAGPGKSPVGLLVFSVSPD